MAERIPTLDLADFRARGSTAHAFVQQLGKAYETFGFVAVTNHLLSADLQERLYAAVQAFFELPEAQKLAYEVPDGAGQRGYTPKGREHAKDNPVGDLKEFYHVGQEEPADDPDVRVYPENVWPSEVPAFKTATLEAYRRLEDTGVELLQAIARFLGLELDYFTSFVRGGNSILRPIHYFPIENPEALPEGAVRAGAHEDINLITLLMGASAAGLEVQTLGGEWIPVTALPGALVVNVGDMLQRLTNNRLRSTTHRVVNPPLEEMKSSRYSIPFFLHPRAGMDLSCLPNCISEEAPKAYADVSAGDYLNERLREIGLLA